MRIYEITKSIWGPLIRRINSLWKRVSSTDRTINVAILADAQRLEALIRSAQTLDAEDVQFKTQAINRITALINYLRSTK